MQVKHDFSLKALNTFGVDAKAKYFVSVNTEDALIEALQLPYADKFILGGGSNMLLKKDIDALVILVDLKGISVVEENDQNLLISACAGENWHEFVQYCVNNDYGGLENLSLIPGNVGTSPIQNIGAYGVELKDTFYSCNVIDKNTLESKTLSLEDCNFGYRDSVFKNEEKGRFIITSVTFKLTKKNHKLHTQYGDITQVLEARKIKDPSIKDVAEAVISIRQQKLPDPKVLGNSGSFFKNPVVDQKTFETLQKQYPEIPFYPMEANTVKIPAGWLIEKAGLKGKRFGNAGMHDKQALVLVNHGDATGSEIWEVALNVQQKVMEQFNILLQPEVNVIG